MLPDVIITMREVEEIFTRNERSEAERQYNELLWRRMRDAGWPVGIGLFSNRIIITGPGGYENWAEVDRNRYVWVPADNLSPPRDSQAPARAGILQTLRAAGRKLGAWRPF